MRVNSSSARAAYAARGWSAAPPGAPVSQDASFRDSCAGPMGAAAAWTAEPGAGGAWGGPAYPPIGTRPRPARANRPVRLGRRHRDLLAERVVPEDGERDLGRRDGTQPAAGQRRR